MDPRVINTQHLNDFVISHQLRNHSSVIRFDALVSIITESNRLVNQIFDTLISFDNYDSYGRVLLLDSKIDPYIYPTDFDGKWQEMRHIDKATLVIRGTHRQNPVIGNYNVRISPIGSASR